MAEKNVNATEEANVSAKPAAAKKAKAKKPNFFKKAAKFFKDTAGEMKKVVWTPKAEVFKNAKLVIATVVVVAVIIAVIDFGSSWLINALAGVVSI